MYSSVNIHEPNNIQRNGAATWATVIKNNKSRGIALMMKYINFLDSDLMALIISLGMVFKPPVSVKAVFYSLLSTASARKAIEWCCYQICNYRKAKENNGQGDNDKQWPEYPSYPFPPT